MKPKEVSRENPCPHCGKPDWCYSIGELSVCNRQAEPANGWRITSKKDKNGLFYYAPEEKEVKPFRKAQTRSWIYTNLDGNPLLKVCRIDYGNGQTKKIWQEHFNGERWVKGYEKTNLSQIALYQQIDLFAAINKGEKIFIVEGEPKADLLISMGLTATCNIGGSKAWRSHYNDQLKGAKVVLVPDRDKPGIKFCQQLAEELKGVAASIEWLYPCPSSPFWALKKLPPSNGLDILDWIQDDGAGIKEILAAIQSDQRPDHVQTEPVTVQTKIESFTEPYKKDDSFYWNDGNISKKLEDWQLREFLSHLKKRIQFDTLKSRIVIDGEAFTMEDDIKFWFLEKFNLRASKQDIKDGLLWAAKKQTFNPVQEYLENCTKTAIPCDIENVATRYFGRSEPIFNRMVKMWLISAVARALDPGCQVDHTLILQSSQGKYKSTWFKILGGDWFSDSLKDIDNKDSLLMLHSNWILEFSELDRVTSKKQAGTIKHFLTQRTDHFRKPYGYEVQEQKRCNVFCGTVNPSKFLVDDENRRFWIIPIADSIEAINIQLIEQERDGIWAAAYAAYQQGQRWWPDDTEKVTISLLTQGFKEDDDWEQPIYEYINDKEFVSSYEVLTKGLGLQEKDITPRESRRVTRILEAFGWTKEARKEVDGKFRRVKLNPNFNGNSGNSGKSFIEREFDVYHFPDPYLVTAVNENSLLPDNQMLLPHLDHSETQSQKGVTRYTTKNHHSPERQKKDQNSNLNSFSQNHPTIDIQAGDRVYYRDNFEIIYTVIAVYPSGGVKVSEWGKPDRKFNVTKADLTKINEGGSNGKK